MVHVDHLRYARRIPPDAPFVDGHLHRLPKHAHGFSRVITRVVLYTMDIWFADYASAESDK